MLNKDLESRKGQQRKLAVEARDALSYNQVAEKSRIICEKLIKSPAFCESDIIFSYQAFRNEVDLSDFNQYATEAGKTVACPICGKVGQMVAAVPDDSNAWTTDRFGIRTPLKERSRIISPEEIHLVLVPCTAFDGRQRMRIGWGAGFYDRYLPQCVNAFSIAAAYQIQKTEPISFDPEWDVPLDAIVTEENWY